MDICFIDESGSAETLCETQPASTPVYAILGLFVPDGHLMQLNWDFLALKKRYHPHLAGAEFLSDVIKYEIKGSDLRSDIRVGNRNQRRAAFGLLDQLMSLVEQHQCRVAGRILIKEQNAVLNDVPIYTQSIAFLCTTFHKYLIERDHEGLMLLDARTKVKNTPLTGRITTSKFRQGGDLYPRLAEVPVFGHSDSHVALQIADLLVGGVVFPSACSAFCRDHVWNTHAHSAYDEIRNRYGQRLKALQYRYFDSSMGHPRGGIHVMGDGVSQSPLFAATEITPEMFTPKDASATIEELSEGVAPDAAATSDTLPL